LKPGDQINLETTCCDPGDAVQRRRKSYVTITSAPIGMIVRRNLVRPGTLTPKLVLFFDANGHCSTALYVVHRALKAVRGESRPNFSPLQTDTKLVLNCGFYGNQQRQAR
jgi:hypothetical protein